MRIGLHLRNAGPQATRAMLRDCARIADATPGIDDLWVFDHLAIPPADSEGSDGWYVDPLATLAFVAGVTERIAIGTRVLILPYRPALPTAKWIASVQALSGGRMMLGVGVGWLEGEFRALGVDRARRGRIADETLEVIERCFADDAVTLNGQTFLFRPRPAKPPVFVGGRGPHAFRRAARFGDGWAVPAGDAAALRDPIRELTALFREAGKPAPEVVVQLRTPAEEIEGLKDTIRALEKVGVTRAAINAPHETPAAFQEIAKRAAALAGC